MKYEYNGNLNIEDRIVNVCNDIKECYPNIPIDKLKKIAVLEVPIMDNIVNNKFKFKRLYHILIVINNDISLSNTYNKVLEDIKKVYINIPNEEIEDEKDIISNILRFKNNNNETFYVG